MEFIAGVFLFSVALILGITLPCILVWYILVKVGVVPAPPYE